MFQVTTLDLKNIPKTEEGEVDFSKDFFKKPTNLTVSGQLNGEPLPRLSGISILLDQHSGQRIQTLPATPLNSG